MNLMTDSPQGDEPQKLLKIKEVADLFQISRSTAFRMMKAQSWPRHKFGTEIRFSTQDIEAIQAMNREVAAPPKTVPNVGIRANRRKLREGD